MRGNFYWAKQPTLASPQFVNRAECQQGSSIRRATQERAWFRQSERLNIARREYRLRGPRFVDFARRLGITDQTSAYHLVVTMRDGDCNPPARLIVRAIVLSEGTGHVAIHSLFVRCPRRV